MCLTKHSTNYQCCKVNFYFQMTLPNSNPYEHLNHIQNNNYQKEIFSYKTSYEVLLTGKYWQELMLKLMPRTESKLKINQTNSLQPNHNQSLRVASIFLLVNYSLPNTSINCLLFNFQITKCYLNICYSQITLCIQCQKGIKTLNNKKQMNSSRNQTFSLVIRYQQQLKRRIQQTQNLVLDNRKDPGTLNNLNMLIQQQERLMKCLQVQSCQMEEQLKVLYGRNIQRFKKKIREHKEYVNTFFGADSYHSNNPHDFRKAAILENQNLQLQTNKMTMYQNQQIQNTMGYDLDHQGQVLRGGFQDHRKIREQAQEASGAITLIQKAILKRKIMFGSLILFLAIGLIIVIIRKVNKVADFVK